MASYQELFDLRQDSELLNKITTAIAIKCKAVLDNGATAGQKVWVRSALQNPEEYNEKIIWFMLVAGAGLSVAQITGASDSQIQGYVNVAIDDLIDDLA